MATADPIRNPTAAEDLVTNGRNVTGAAVTGLTSDTLVNWTSIAGAVVYTLPLLASVPVFKTIIVQDGTGGASGANTISVTRAGADTVNGTTTVAAVAAAWGRCTVIATSAGWVVAAG